MAKTAVSGGGSCLAGSVTADSFTRVIYRISDCHNYDAFLAEKENLDIVSKPTLEKHRKKLGVGFISNIIVEDDDTIINRYRRIEKLVGKENIRYLHPDCGFGLTRPEKVKLILEKMKKIGESIN